jgi:hypothetical protein
MPQGIGGNREAIGGKRSVAHRSVANGATLRSLQYAL